jgi:hypothetical protein
VAAKEDQPDTTEDPRFPATSLRASPLRAPLRGAALAAGLLENACTPGSGDPLQLKIVRVLARGLKEELENLAGLAAEETGAAQVEGVEGALRAADVANLAACAVPELLETRAPEAAAAAYLATGAIRALSSLIEADVEDSHERQVSYALKDARGAAWRARLATRQVDEFLNDEG